MYRALRSVEGDLTTGILEGLLGCLGLLEHLYANEPLLLTDDLPMLSIDSDRLIRVGIFDGLELLLFVEVSDFPLRLSFEVDLEKVLIAMPSYTSLKGDLGGVDLVEKSSPCSPLLLGEMPGTLFFS